MTASVVLAVAGDDVDEVSCGDTPGHVHESESSPLNVHCKTMQASYKLTERRSARIVTFAFKSHGESMFTSTPAEYNGAGKNFPGNSAQVTTPSFRLQYPLKEVDHGDPEGDLRVVFVGEVRLLRQVHREAEKTSSELGAAALDA